MKFPLFAAAIMSATTLAALPAAAQGIDPMFYGTAGAGVVDDGLTFGIAVGRLGARLHENFGVEAEGAFGIQSDNFDLGGGVSMKTKIEYSAAAYAVVFVPLTERLEILARAGYGATKLRGSILGISATSTDESWNYGVGVQYMLDDLNGVRLDYTRLDFKGPGGADAYAVSYLRKF